MHVREGFLSGIPRRAASDLLLFGVTAAELIVLVLLTPTFTAVDWIYVFQHLWVLAIALTRRPPAAQDLSATTSLAVAASCVYPYAQVIYLHAETGDVV